MTDNGSADPLAKGLLEALSWALLGRATTSIEVQGEFGPEIHTLTVKSAFEEKIRMMVHKGDFDEVLSEAVSQLDPADIAEGIKATLVEHVTRELKSTGGGYNRDQTWMQKHLGQITKEAATAALKGDDATMDTLRSKIGMEVDRNRVDITVKLSDPETAS